LITPLAYLGAIETETPDVSRKGGQVLTIEERNAIVESYIPLVRRLAHCIIRSGQRPTIEVADLIAAGNLSVVRDVRSGAGPWAISRHAKTNMIRHITSEIRHWNQRKNWEEMFDGNGREKF
jgi:hypothetical protein